MPSKSIAQNLGLSEKSVTSWMSQLAKSHSDRVQVAVEGTRKKTALYRVFPPGYSAKRPKLTRRDLGPHNVVRDRRSLSAVDVEMEQLRGQVSSLRGEVSSLSAEVLSLQAENVRLKGKQALCEVPVSGAHVDSELACNILERGGPLIRQQQHNIALLWQSYPSLSAAHLIVLWLKQLHTPHILL